MSVVLRDALVPALYLLSAVLFILGLKGLTRVKSAMRGNRISALAMLIAVVATLIDLGTISYQWILVGLVVGGLIGLVVAARVEMTAMPEMVALFNGCGGAASALVALAVVWLEVVEKAEATSLLDLLGGASSSTVSLSVFIGGVTTSGSVIAYLKLRGTLRRTMLLPGRHALNAALIAGSVALGGWLAFGPVAGGAAVDTALLLAALALLLGVLLVIPIGGADMPVVISLLNSYSGLAASATGFILENNVLIISGALVGASGLILTQIMCKAMNRSLLNVLLGGFGEAGVGVGDGEYVNVKSCGAEEAALMLEAAGSVVVVPGYGLAVAQAQHALREMAQLLEKNGASVQYAIHPVAGRMPGHMNVLLAEADVPYEQLVEMDAINSEFSNTDVVLVIGANDVVNPAAEDKSSPIYGMPILEVHQARSVLVVKRSLSPGYAGIKNSLFENDNTMMVFGDGKKVIQSIINELKSGA